MEVEVEDTAPLEEEIRERILREREVAEAERIARDKELEEESIQLDKEIEQEIRGKCSSNRVNDESLILIGVEMTEEEKHSVFTAPEFLEFLEQSTKIVQRALNDNYDYTRDYTIGTEAGG